MEYEIFDDDDDFHVVSLQFARQKIKRIAGVTYNGCV